MDELLVNEEKKIYTITLNRPDKLNAINYRMMENLKKCLTQAEENDRIHLVLFKGAGDRAFSAGLDTIEILSLPIEKKNAFFELLLDISKIALTSNKLYMTEIRGFAVAAGFAFCLFSDFKIAEDKPEIYFALPEVEVGVFPFAVMALSLYNFPPSIAIDMLFSGGKLPLQRANELGFINRIFSAENFEKSARKYIREITSQNITVLRLGKACYNIQRMQILKNIIMEKDFTQKGFKGELDTNTTILQLKEKWGLK